MFNRIIQAIVCLVVLFILSSSKANAAIIFEDNFDSYANGEFPTKWQSIHQPGATVCNAPWKVVNGEVGVKIVNQGSCTTNIMPNEDEWPLLVNDYIFEAKMRIVGGTDHNIVYRIVPEGVAIYEVHFLSPGDFVVGLPPGSTFNTNISKSYPFGSYNLKIVVNGLSLRIYIDEVLVRDITMPSPLPLGKIALRAGAGSDPNSETWFDNVRVTTLDHQDALAVPLLKQSSAPWGDDLYDSANLWSGNKNDISRWGCALTSAAMVFQYHGVKKLPDNTNLDPGTLNKWLRSQPDGYVRNGNVNWLALSRLSLLAKSKNSYEGFDALEYSRFGASKSKLSEDLENGLPVILEEPGHFIVAKGEDTSTNTFLINDPFYSRDTLLDYGNTFLSLRRFVPSQTDLSYMMFVVEENITLRLRDGNGNEVGESYTQEPIFNTFSDSQNPRSVKMLYLQKPESGDYTLEVVIPAIARYTLDGYLYDTNGNVKKIESKGIIGGQNTDTYHIKFNKEDSNKGNMEMSVTFDSLKKDLKSLYDAGMIKSFGTYILWSAEVDQAKTFSKFSKKGAKSILETLRNQISREKKAIDSTTKALLVNQLKILLSTL